MEVFNKVSHQNQVLIGMTYPWLSVSGFGAHIKSTQKQLIIQKKNGVEYHPIDSVKNLLIIGGHSINSMTILHLVKNGTYITFFEPDGIPVGTIQPYGDNNQSEISEIQKAAPRQRFAVAFAQDSMKSRLFAVEHVQEQQNVHLFYEGEYEFLRKSLDELEFLIKLEEIRRLHRLTSDMYYEIMSRNIPPEWGFKRRTMRPHTDPVNAMLSFGYAILFGNCYAAIVGSRLNADLGLMHEGKAGLIYDFIEPLKAEMIDPIVFSIAREHLNLSDFEQTRDRCMLSDDIIDFMMKKFYKSIQNEKIYLQVQNFNDSLKNQL